MWFVHNCLTWGSACQPQSWADLGELLAATALVLGVIAGSFILLLWAGD